MDYENAAQSIAEDIAYQARLDAVTPVFDRWYSQTGHWIYQDRAEALMTWQERGIEGLPKYPE